MAVGTKRCTTHPHHRFHELQTNCDDCGARLVEPDLLPVIFWKLLKIYHWKQWVRRRFGRRHLLSRLFA